MTVLKKIWDFLLLAEKTIMIIASIGVVMLIFCSVIMRYLLELNFEGMEELVVMIAFWIYFIGGTYGSYEGSHITADILSVFVTDERKKLIISFIREIITTIVLFAASYCAIELIQYTAESGAITTVLKMPMQLVYLPIYIGIFMMNFYALVHAVIDGINLFSRKGKEVQA